MNKRPSDKGGRSKKVARPIDVDAQATLIGRPGAWRDRLSDFVGVLPELSTVTDLENLRREWDS